ncbi:hypothetical protein B7P43_G10884 [Cryptotermes secundus]|uniref:Uncharacterized protein n=1 Tax=Cryptotermes secundus TaxID=105785 RepID=A0A2J7QPK0_9NEOP|nr:uncharacterized protein LOC111866218 isoform X2 [Cryptotermes secundus]PNF30483.1 hypothetical protein B7P43_G10884 [Cryptotermes secundus]
MKIILALVALTMCVIPTSLGAPQIFPFSNLRSYFDHQVRNGPGGGKHGVVPDLTAVVDTPLFRQPSKIGDIPVKTVSSPPPTIYATNQQATNHKPDASPSLEPPSASAVASPVAKYNLPVPEQVPISVVGEKKYTALGGFLPLAPPYLLLNPPAVSQQKPTGPYSATVPSQNVQLPAVALKYPEKKVTQQTQDNLQLPQPIIPAKTTKAPNHIYPKKWRPEKEKDTIKKKNPKTDAGILSTVNSDIVSNPPKKERKQIKEQSLPAPLVAASSFQKADLTLFPAQAKRKVPGIDEQITSETGFSGITAGVGGYGVGGGGGGGGDRVEFQMHGQHGPHSYKFGFDTGKGHNRQFRYEERDTHGHVKGHYGFYNKHGKLQIVNYSAHPEHGFHADGNYGNHGIV